MTLMFLLPIFINNSCISSPDRHSVQLESPISEKELEFRKTYWGKGVDEIKKSENMKPGVSIGGIHMYEHEFLSFPVTIVYLCGHGKFDKAQYQFNQKHSEKVKEFIFHKYGEPKECFADSRDEAFSDEKRLKLSEKWYEQIGYGNRLKNCEWHLDKTYITLTLSKVKGTNLRLSLTCDPRVKQNC
jgi:hypothetical protein